MTGALAPGLPLPTFATVGVGFVTGSTKGVGFFSLVSLSPAPFFSWVFLRFFLVCFLDLGADVLLLIELPRFDGVVVDELGELFGGLPVLL